MLKRQYIYFFLVVVLALLIPVFIKDAFYMNVFILILLWSYSASCWNILGGMTGQHSFGHALFFGLGAYTSSLLFIHYGMSPWITMWVGALLSGLIGLFIGYLSFKYSIKGLFFLMVTISFAEIFRIIFFSMESLGGASGISLPFNNQALNFQFADKIYFYYIALAMCIGILALTQYIKVNRVGYYFVAIRENEDTAKASGINVFRYKLIATFISASLTSLAGTFYAQYFLYIDPGTIFGVPTSFEMVIFSVVGGAGNVLGPLLGATVLVPISEFMRVYSSASFKGASLIAYGSLLVIVMIFMPKGITGFLQRFRRREDKEGENSR